VARGGTDTRRISRATALLLAFIVLVFVAAAVRVPGAIKDSHQRKRDRVAYIAWMEAHGGRIQYGAGVTETHKRFDIVCTPHYPGGRRSRGADYRLFLLVDWHGSGPARVVRSVRGPLKVIPTATGSKCGAMPVGPPG
jgi:hypothetical protein